MTSGSTGTGPPPRVLPPDRDRNAETLAWLADALDAVAGISRTLMDDGKMDRDPVEVFSAAKPALRRLANFRSLAFLSVDEDGLTFDLEDVDPDRAVDLVRRELEHQVDEGTFAWSIYQNRAVVVPGAHLGPWIVLHPLATPTRVLGMFLGSLSADSAFLPDTCQKVLSILMLNCASEMESGLLYRELNRHNQNLEAIIEERTEELRRSEQAARSASRAKSEFLANMSHEIRTPINGIVGMNSLMLAGDLRPDQKEQAETILRSADNLLTIINDILDFSKIEAGHLDLEDLPYDLQVAAEDVCELLSARAHAKGIEVVTRYRPNTPRLVLGDPGRMRQILTNLLGNAIKFTESGQVAVDVDWTPGLPGQGQMRIAVEDTGIGIEGDKLARIFDKFTQADTSTTRIYGGTGLGLAISLQLARLMGGDLLAESTVGKGSRFIVEIPVEVAEGGEEAPPAMLVGVGIAVIDPNESTRLSIKDTLDAMGARTIVAPNIEALEKLLGSEPADLQMALVDYAHEPQHLRETAQRIRAMSDTPYMVLLSTMSDRGEALGHVGLGFDDVLLKPVRYRRLVDAVTPVSVKVPERGEPKDIFAQPTVGADGPVAVVRSIVGARILLVEDEPVNRLVASQMIKKLGHDVAVVGNGQEAVSLLERDGSDSFDLIFMDCQTPVLDGFEATRQIRAREASGGPRANIVALTASALQGDREKCIAAGMDDYLSKPVRIGDVEEMLARWLTREPESRESATGDPEPGGGDLGSAEPRRSADARDVAQPPDVTEGTVPAPRTARVPVGANTPAMSRSAPGASNSTYSRAPARPMDVGPSERPAATSVQTNVSIPTQETTPVTAETESAVPVLDIDGALDTLGGDWDLFWTITNLFSDGWPDVDTRFEAAVAARDANALRQTAHFLKGGSGNVGATRVRQLCLEFEKRAAVGRIEDAEERFAEIRTAMHAYLGELAMLRRRARSATGA